MALTCKLLPKVVECQYCNTEVHRGDEFFKLASQQIDAHRALNEHLAKCSKASEKIKGLLKKARGEKSAHIATSNCPCCGFIARADHIIRHILSKHSKMSLVLSMPKDERKEALKACLPVVKAYKDGTLLFRVCLHCKKGCLATSMAKMKGDLTINMIKRKEKHTDCVAHFEDYKYLFEMEEKSIDMPFHLYNCADPENPTQRNYITLDDEEPEVKPKYIVKAKRLEIEAEAKEKVELPIEETLEEIKKENEALKTRLALAERQTDFLERTVKEKDKQFEEFKEKEKKPESTSAPEDIIKLLRKLVNDNLEEFDLEELYEEAEEAVERSLNLEDELSKEHRKTLAKLNRRIQILQNTVDEKDKIIETFGTVSFGRAGRSMDSSSEDSDYE
jgi:hypothetical protein